jgi:hypothetical protein
MAYFSRRFTGKRSLSAETLYLLIVVGAAVVTVYWAARTIGIDVSSIDQAAWALGIDERVATTHQVGYSQTRDEAKPAPSAPYARRVSCRLSERHGCTASADRRRHK